MKRSLLLLGCLGIVAWGKAAAQRVPEWVFKEDLRIGSERDDVTGFSDIRGLLVDQKGNIWVLEASTQEIRIFDPTGRHLRNVGRKGKGPGEFVYADGMALAPDGLVWVHDPQNVRFSIFDQEGKFVRQQLAPASGYGFVWAGGIDSRYRIWDQIYTEDPKDPLATRMRRASSDWTRVDTLTLPGCRVPGEKPGDAVFRHPGGTTSVPFYPGSVSAVDYTTGSYWCAPSGAEYRVLKLGLERRDTLVRINGNAARVPVTSSERDSAINYVKERMKRRGEAPQDWSRIPRYKPMLLSAFVADDGRLWVRRSSTDAHSPFDVYSPQGKLLATARFTLPISVIKRPVIKGSVAYFISQLPGELPYVVRGRLVPAP